MRVFIRSMGSLDFQDMKKFCEKVIFWAPSFGGFGARMRYKKAEMAKTLRNGLSIIETNPLKNNGSDFVI